MRKRYYGKLVISIIIVVILSFCNAKNFIAYENHFMIALSYLCAILLVYYFIEILQRVFSGKYEKHLLIISGVYALFICGLLVLTYPAVISWGDMISIWNETVVGNIQWHYMYLTSVFHLVAKMIFPTMAAAAILQGVFLVMFATHFSNRIHSIFGLSYFCGFLPFLIQPIVFYCLYPNRMPLFSMLYAFLFSEIILDYKEGVFDTKKEILYIVLGAILAVWRKESIFLLLVIPAVIVLMKYNVLKWKEMCKKIVIMLVMCMIIILPQKLNYNPPSSQQLGTILLGYLTAMSYEGYDFNNLEDKECIDVIKEYVLLEKIDNQVLVLAENCLGEVYGNFGEHYAWIKDRNDGTIDFKPFYKACIELFLRNPGLTLQARWDMVMYSLMGNSNFVDGNPTATIQENYIGIESQQISINENRELFNYWFSRRVIAENDIEIFILKIIKALAYNTIIPLIVLVSLAIIELRENKSKLFLMLIISWTIHFVILLASMPCGYFMYYLPLYMLGYLMLICMIGSVKNTLLSKR